MTRLEASPAGAAEMRARWSALHGGYDAESSPVLRSWLVGVHLLGRWLARRGVSPNAVTFAAVVVAAGAAGAARRAPRCAAGLIAGSVVLDGVDGAVAIVTDRVTERGASFDTAADRIADACFGLALGRAGAPLPASLLAAASPVGFEWWRSRLTAGRRRGVGQVTPGDRPTRVVIVIGALMLAGARRRHARMFATTGSVATVGACAVGAVRLRQIFDVDGLRYLAG